MPTVPINNVTITGQAVGLGNCIASNQTFPAQPEPIFDTGDLGYVNGLPLATLSQFGDFQIDNQNQVYRTITTEDSPKLTLDGLQPCDQASLLNNISGNISFSTYLLAYSTDAPQSYAAYGVATWVTTAQGTVTFNNAAQTFTWNRQTPATGVNSSGFITTGYPEDAADAGVQTFTPVGLNVIRRNVANAGP